MNEKEAESEEELSPMKPYASDLSDAEWAILQREAEGLSQVIE